MAKLHWNLDPIVNLRKLCLTGLMLIAIVWAGKSAAALVALLAGLLGWPAGFLMRLAIRERPETFIQVSSAPELRAAMAESKWWRYYVRLVVLFGLVTVSLAAVQGIDNVHFLHLFCAGFLAFAFTRGFIMQDALRDLSVRAEKLP